MAEGVNVPMVGFIGGLGGLDIRPDDIDDCLERLNGTERSGSRRDVHWLGMEA